jgi:protein TonB
LITFGRAIIVALVINTLLVLAAAQLVRERPQSADITVPTVVSLITVPDDEAPPEEEDQQPPPPPEQPPQMDFTPELPTPSLTAPALSGPSVALDASLFGGAAPMSNMIFEASELDQPPRAVVRTPPEYPYRARQRRIEGSVQVRFLVNVDGTTSQVTIVDSQPPGVFDQAAVDAVSRWRFEPGRLAGEPVAAWVVAPITFDLSGGG